LEQDLHEDLKVLTDLYNEWIDVDNDPKFDALLERLCKDETIY
jgi:hypothetical protein